MAERVQLSPLVEHVQPRLRPQESTQRAATIAVDMTVMMVQYMNTLSQFLPLGELAHLQMHLLYGLIDVMSITASSDPDSVLDMARGYFKHLRRERNEMLRNGNDGAAKSGFSGEDDE